MPYTYDMRLVRICGVLLVCLMGITAVRAGEIEYRNICDDPDAYHNKSVTFRTTYLGTHRGVWPHVEAVLPVSKYYHFRQGGFGTVPIVLKRTTSSSKTMENLKDGMSITVIGTVGRKVWKSQKVYYVLISKIKAEKSEVKGVSLDKLDTGDYTEVNIKDLEDDPLSYENKKVQFTCPYYGTVPVTQGTGKGIGQKKDYIRLTTHRKGKHQVQVFILKTNKEVIEMLDGGSIKKNCPIEVFGRVRAAEVLGRKHPYVIVECINQPKTEDSPTETEDEKDPAKDDDPKKRKPRKRLFRRWLR